MKFRTTQEDLKGLAVNLGGVIYPIDSDGVVDVPDSDGQTLASINGWVEIDACGVVPQEDSEIADNIETSEDEPPDPSMDMTKKELIALAELYEINTRYLSKQELVDAIYGRMYPNGKE